MSTRGSISLGDLRGKLDMLEVACHRCDRRGRLSLERLIAEPPAIAAIGAAGSALSG